MTKSAMPQVGSGLEDTKHLFIRRWLERVEPSFTPTSMEGFLHPMFLDEKMTWTEFKECIVILCKTVYTNETFASLRNMENIV